MKKNFGTKTVLAPLPVLIIATYDEQGTPDAMNAAWGGQCGPHHVALNLSPKHKTTENIQLKGAFTVSVADADHLTVADYFGLVSGRKENKIERAGVHVTPSAFVDAPVIDEFPLTLECKVVEMQETSLGEMRIVGEVVNMQADESILDMQEMIHEYRDIQPYYYGDYYPLTGIGDQTSDSVWLAYQLHLPEKDQGIIVAFRRQHCEQESLTVCCGGLDAAADYEVFNVDTGIRETCNGAAMAKGLVLKAEQPRGSVLLKYKRVGH